MYSPGGWVYNILRLITRSDLPPYSPNLIPIVYYIYIILLELYYHIEPYRTVLVLDVVGSRFIFI